MTTSQGSQNPRQLPDNSNDFGVDEDLATTYHSSLSVSTLRNGAASDLMVIVKKSRNQDNPRTLVRYDNEVAALKAASRGEGRSSRLKDSGLPRTGQDHIVQLLDYNREELTLTLSYESGGSLEKYVNAEYISIVLASEADIICHQIASALSFLHLNSIIHDDVKPDNIMWCAETRHAVLIDFGAALLDMPEGYFTESGTPNYAAPEYLRCEKSAKGDVWGLGVTMLFLYGYVPLPDGEWILPIALKEDTAARVEMLAWLAQVERLRSRIVAETNRLVLAAMLEPQTADRISSSELLHRLSKESVCLEPESCG